MSKKLGTLRYDPGTERYEIYFDAGGESEQLHCGNCFEVKVGRRWMETRIEYGNDWYLVGQRLKLDGLRVRV